MLFPILFEIPPTAATRVNPEGREEGAWVVNPVADTFQAGVVTLLGETKEVVSGASFAVSNTREEASHEGDVWGIIHFANSRMKWKLSGAPYFQPRTNSSPNSSTKSPLFTNPIPLKDVSHHPLGLTVV